MSGSFVVAAVRDLARSHPDRVAVVGDDGPIGYGDLWRRAEEAAALLCPRSGVVTVPAVHEPATVVSLLGAWLAGGTYCPVDPSFPAEHVDALLGSLSGQPLDDDTAYVLFTSGSTGRPKPVAVPHRALAAVVPALRELFGLTPEDRVLQYASLSWDTAFEELLPTLATGAGVVFGCDAHRGSLSRLLGLVERAGVTVLNLPTAVWHELVLHLAEYRVGVPASVRLVVIGGEAVNPARLAAWRSLPGVDGVRLLNTYGATETALITHAVDLHGPLASGAGGGGAAPLGRPLAHVRQRVTDGGELLVGGPGLASGYPGLPEATDERFVERDGERWFRTGDLVREDDRGLLHARGRLDAQVKVRGIRVDPGEVESHLLRHLGVAAAAVLGVVVADRTALAAYVVSAPSATGDLVATIRAFLREHAPSHLHPARITVVPDLVLTTSGKVDRRATHALYGAPTRKASP